jgi:type IV secretory pathway protease TraF
VVDRQGRPLPGVEVLLLQAGNPAARTVTAADGRFQVRRLSSGIYEISAAGGAGIYRIWQRGAAPPNAVGSALIVAGPDAVRGQSPRTGFFRSDAFLISAAVVGAVAIPIFISAARRESPPGS